jgi:STAT protein, all-alpha domain
MEQQQPMLQASGGSQDIIQAEINQQLEYLRIRTQKTGEECRRIEQEQEAFALQYHECTKLNGILHIFFFIYNCLYFVVVVNST